ncbi:MAG TPA: hypothetical protein VKT77_06495, partial [Chthonomonadaceae bacterium]|nr:hypothetical protein [Chthonomonadaceae bacterium]
MGLLLSPDHGATLTDPLTWTDNPFVVRDTRRDIKRRQPFVSFCWMCGVLLVVAPWAAGTLWSVQTAATMLPPMFGVSHGSGDIGTILFFLIAGVHIWFIIGAAQRHTIRQFTDESNQNTLSSLLMLPASPFQVLVQSMVYPWMVAMRLAVALLPVYVFCVAIDGPSWLDLVMLYVVFALAALSVPFWNRPALSENVAILTAPKQTGAGARQTAVGRDAAAARSMSISGALALRLALIPVALIWIITVSTGGLSNGLEWLQQYLPTSVVALIEPIVVSWPLLIARLLVSPLDWFGTPLIPLPFVLVLFLVERYLRLVRASELLSVGAYRDLPLQATYLSRRRLEAWYRGALALVVTGYLWKPLVAQGALAWLAPRTAGTPQGLPGFLFLLIFVAGLWAMGRGAALGQWQHAPFIRGERAILCRNSILDGARYLAAPFGCTLAFYLLCCLLARAEPFPGLQNSLAGGSAAMALQMTLIAMAGALFSFGVSRLVGGGGLLLRLI